MFYRLCCREQAGIKGRRAFVFLHDLGAFIGNSDDRVTFFCLGLFVDEGEDFFKPRYVLFGLAAVFFECFFQLWRLGRFCHFREGSENLLFREIDVFKRVVK